MTPSLRPAHYDEITKAITVTLTEEDRALCYQQSCGSRGRFQVNRRGNNYDAAFRKGGGPTNDIEGLIAESAFTFLCGQVPTWHGMVFTMEEWATRRGPDGGQLTDVLGVEVRATHHADGHLPVFIDGKDKEKPEATPYLLGIVQRLQDFNSVIKTGDLSIDAKLEAFDIRHYGLRVVFPGWCLRSDVRPDHLKGWDVPNHAVPQHELRPMTALSPGRFVMPMTESDDIIASVL